MKVTEAEFCKGYVTLADDMWNLGFHERNGGNLTYRMTKEDVESVKENFTFDRPYTDIGTAVPTLAGAYFFVSGSGKFFRWMKEKTDDTCAIIEIDESGTRYRIVWGLVNGGRPTSELPTHLMNHEVRMRATNGAHRIIYHGHPANLIAMTFVLPMSDGAFTKELWESMTECPVIFPAGVGVVPWMVPGGREIAVASAKKMETYDVVIWAHHGLFCSGDTFDNVFGLAHCVEKSAEIYMKVRAVTNQKTQTITKENFLDLAKAFGFAINEDLLN